MVLLLLLLLLLLPLRALPGCCACAACALRRVQWRCASLLQAHCAGAAQRLVCPWLPLPPLAPTPTTLTPSLHLPMPPPACSQRGAWWCACWSAGAPAALLLVVVVAGGRWCQWWHPALRAWGVLHPWCPLRGSLWLARPPWLWGEGAPCRGRQLPQLPPLLLPWAVVKPPSAMPPPPAFPWGWARSASSPPHSRASLSSVHPWEGWGRSLAALPPLQTTPPAQLLAL